MAIKTGPRHAVARAPWVAEYMEHLHYEGSSWMILNVKSSSRELVCPAGRSSSLGLLPGLVSFPHRQLIIAKIYVSLDAQQGSPSGVDEALASLHWVRGRMGIHAALLPLLALLSDL